MGTRVCWLHGPGYQATQERVSMGIKEARETQDLLLWCYQRSVGVSRRQLSEIQIREKARKKNPMRTRESVHSNKLETGVTAGREYQRLSQISLLKTQARKLPPKPSFSSCGFLHLLGAGSAPKQKSTAAPTTRTTVQRQLTQKNTLVIQTKPGLAKDNAEGGCGNARNLPREVLEEAPGPQVGIPSYSLVGGHTWTWLGPTG